MYAFSITLPSEASMTKRANRAVSSGVGLNSHRPRYQTTACRSIAATGSTKAQPSCLAVARADRNGCGFVDHGIASALGRS